MTEYGRGYGSEPWHPEDPLYGDQGPYGGQAQQPQWDGQQSAPYPQQHHPQQQYNGGWDGTQGGQLPYDPYDPYAQQQPPADPYGGAGQDYYGHQDPYQQPQQPQQPQHGQQQMPRHPQYQQAPQRQQQYPPQQYDQFDQYEQQYPPQQYEQHTEPPYEDTAGDDWRADPERPREPEPEHSFFADDDDDDGGHPDDDARERKGGRDRRGKKNGKKNGKNKRRSGTACLVVTLVFAGAVGAVGYFGYDFFMAHFGAAPDYEGEGSGAVQVEIAPGSVIKQMGLALEKAGVIKSADAFVEAAGEDDKKARLLQPGTYSLRKHMSAASAFQLMLDPKSRNGLTVREGLRAKEVYALIDKKLHLKKGTTKDVAKSDVKNLGLPSWADYSRKIKDPLEGFLYPSTYSVGENAKPAAVLKQMVARANQVYEKYDLQGNAQKLNLSSPMQLLTVASLTQAEGKYKHDFVKVARVVYNRLKPANTETYGLLDFDSTVNYARSQSTLDTGSVDDLRHFNDLYNTYKFKGLPPGPINNPGEVALNSAIHPAKGNWYYFVSISPEKTLFAATNEEHERNRRIYLKEHGKPQQ
ncbi:endolytic transglycosylase MltG [Streptomyces sp. NPDC101150]|uniref:endolytic transglycosylase MltG n=1 Tax=Streptomyces sp. NPDC101150 TaxID=3366114 RepID=UPI003801EEED